MRMYDFSKKLIWDIPLGLTKKGRYTYHKVNKNVKGWIKRYIDRKERSKTNIIENESNIH